MKKSVLKLALETIEEYANLSEFEINKEELLKLDKEQRKSIYEKGRREGYKDGYDEGFNCASEDIDE
tara:strand:+ start:355 stop:555 length:201 start_codon:yes stop_codon:yes gene_type:complete